MITGFMQDRLQAVDTLEYEKYIELAKSKIKNFDDRIAVNRLENELSEIIWNNVIVDLNFKAN